MSQKVAVITGASGGIGEALAEVFAKNKYRVVIAARDKTRLSEIALRLREHTNEVLDVVCDVSSEEDCRNLIDAAIHRFGRIDVLINNAGISMRALFSEVDISVLRKVMDVNFWGTVYCSRFALPHLLETKGSLVGISSIAGKKGLPGRTGYSASKFAMEGLLETIRTENIRKGLHVLIACPGFTASNIRKNALSGDGTSQGESPREEEKMMPARQVAELIYLAVRNRKRDLVMTTNGKLTVFLNKFFPSMMDRMVYNHMAKEPDSPFK
jgi:short-subunit dehydrogenase